MRHPVFFIALLLALLEAPRPFLHWNDFILENEMRVEKRFLKEYEQIEESFCDRVDDEGKKMSVREFIRPEDVSYLVADLEELPFHEKVAGVIRYISDHVQVFPDEPGEDYWQKPQETIVRGKGDCEDLAFLAASMLIAAGFPKDRVWINMKNWHLFTIVELEGLTLVVKTGADANYAGSYDWPLRRWNRSVIELRKRKILE
jgi:transglutaminase-like putative cysteine protease